MRKGQQLVGQIIVYVIGLVVVASILLFGYNVIQKVNEDQCRVRAATFSEDMDDFIETMRDFGERDGFRLMAPCETEYVCFVDRNVADEWEFMTTGNPDASFTPETLVFESTVPQSIQRKIRNSIESGVPQNVFAFGLQGATIDLVGFATETAPVQVALGPTQDINAFCISTADEHVEFILEGQGQLARITPR